MRVIEYNDANAFFNDYKQILLENEAACQLILNNIFLHTEAGASGRIFGSVIDDAGVYLMFCKMPSNSMAIYAANKEHIAESAQKLSEYMIAGGFMAGEIRGNYDVCLHLAEHISKNVECSFAKTGEMAILELREVNDIKLAEGIQRPARADEVQLVADWMIESQLEAVSSEMDYEDMLKKAAQYIDDGKVYLFEKDDIVVSMVIKERKLIKGVLLSYIYTPVDYRGEGYAAANVYYLSKALLDEGNEFCTMMADKKNPLSIRTYEKIGYRVIDDIYEYRLYQAD